MKLGHPVLKINHQNAHSLLDRRDAERVPIRYRISYSGEEGARIVTGEGTLKDLSKTGCKILGAATSSLGSTLTLVLCLEDGQVPMRLTDVTVSWISKDSFAVRFPKLSPEERKRLQEMIWKVSACRPWTIDGRHSASSNRLRKTYCGMQETPWPTGLGQARSIWSIWSVWLVSFNQTHETDRTDRIDQIDQMNKTGWRDLFSILLEGNS